ncbi:MAG TPA: Rid family hydrolase [Woeseiaceae bacterium]|nr:Rid family hydrolase [Woeseiaceae bacterium]
MKRLALLFAAIATAGCEVNVDPGTDVEYLQAPGTEDLGLPFSSAVRVDDTLYLSGAIGVIPGTMDLAEGGIQGETRQTLDNNRQTLETFGSSLDKVVKCTVFLADMAEWGAMNEVYRTYFENPPARSALGASGLALNARVEIECIAVTGEGVSITGRTGSGQPQ